MDFAGEQRSPQFSPSRPAPSSSQSPTVDYSPLRPPGFTPPPSSPTPDYSPPNTARPYPEHDKESENAFNRDAESVTLLENISFPPCRDFFFDSSKVLSLNSLNFTTFLKSMDATLVMFYNDNVPACKQYQQIISEAADGTKRANHAYTGVDCGANKKLCLANGATRIPLVRIYSKTYCLGEMETLHTMTPDHLRQLIEMAPVIDASRMVSCARSKKC